MEGLGRLFGVSGTRLLLCGGLVVAMAGGASAQAISDACISLDFPKKVSASCDGRSGIPRYATEVRAMSRAGCPSAIVVEYTDPDSGQRKTHIATRTTTTIFSCNSGVTTARAREEASAAAIAAAAQQAAPAPRPSDTPSRAAMAPTPAPEPTPAPAPSPAAGWNAVAGSVWRVRGAVQVAVGYSGTRSTQEEARAEAVRQCRAAGGPSCKAVGAWDYGCIYITTGRGRRGAGWASGSSVDAAMDRCRKQGYTCRTPIGGCVN